jgi:hypothetical protein
MAIESKAAFQCDIPDDGAAFVAGQVTPSRHNQGVAITLDPDNLMGRASAENGAVEEIPCTAAGRALLDDADAAAQRTTLGLGSAAVEDASSFATSAQGGLADSAVQPGALATVATTGAYGDLSGTPTLGTAAALDVGTGANNVVQLDGSGALPAVDGSALTGISAGGTPGGSDTQVQFNDGGAFGGDSGFVFNKTSKAVTLGGATVTTDAPVLDLSQTWNDAAVTFTGLKLNVTDTASAAGSNLLNLQVGGVNRVAVRKNGTVISSGPDFPSNLVTFGSTSNSGIWLDGAGQLAHRQSGTTNIFTANGIFNIISTGSFRWSTSPGISAGDLVLSRRAAANLQLGAADAAAPVAQTLSVQSVVAGTTDTAGANLTIAGSQGTGTGAGGSIVFRVAPAGASGTAQNSLATFAEMTSARALNIYKTYTDASNYERGFARWNGNVFEVGNEGAGTGSNRETRIGTNVSANVSINGYIDVNVNGVLVKRNLNMQSALYGIATASFVDSKYFRATEAYTVATLPGTPVVGMIARVTDADAPSVGSTVTGSGAAAALVWYNGANWTVIGV